MTMMMNRKRKGSELLLASSKKPCIVVFSSGDDDDDDVNVSCKKRLAATPPTSSSSDVKVNVSSSSSNNNKKRLLAVAATAATSSSSGRGLKRKRKADSELLAPSKKPCILESNLNSHYSLEDWLKKRKEDVNVNINVSSSSNNNNNNKKKKKRLPVACAAVTSSGRGRGLKRKIGCIDVATKKNKIDEDYGSIAPLGKGKFASVWKCTCRATGLDFACKSLPKGGKETVQREVEIMQHLSGHPGVVTLNAVYEDLQSFHLVMELCSGGTLRDQMAIQACFSEQQAASILKELMLVLKYCHQMGVVHRDIKPENILLTASGNIKLADFGLALRITNGQSLAGLAGSPAYVAPEVLCGNYSEKVDVWSAGILLHALLVGVLPFQGHSPEDMFEAIKNVQLNFHTGIWESVSKPARDLLECMLTRNADSRITADEILSHPWIIFHTEKSKSQHQAGPSSQTAAVLELTKRWTVNGGSVINHLEEQDDSGLVDALAVALSNVRISEPKRSRLYMPTSLIREQCWSNVTSNNLCKAC